MNYAHFSRVLGACAVTVMLFLGANPVTAQTDPNVIRVGASTDDGVRPLLYAQQAGLFKKAGLNVEIIKLNNGAAVAAAVAGGSADIGKGSTLTAVLAHAKGLPFTTIANLANFSNDAPDTVMLVRGDTSIKNAKDLVGKTIGVIGLQDFNTLTVYAWLEQNGVDLNSLKFIEVPNAAAPAALEQGRIDATMAMEPMYSSAMAAKKFRVIGAPWSALGKRFSDVVLYANESWVASHRDAVAKFNRAIKDAAAYVAAHEDETKPLIAQFAGFDPAVLQNFHPPVRALSLDPADLQPTIDAAAKFKLIAKAFPAKDMICDCAIAASR